MFSDPASLDPGSLSKPQPGPPGNSIETLGSDSVESLLRPRPMAAPPTLPTQPRQILSPETLAVLNQRSNRSGLLQLAAHGTLLGISGYLWATAPLWLALPALAIYGAGLAFMFCTMHECAHRTAFANPQLNDAVAWLAGLLSFYNSTFYRRYHKWHHRYTQIAGKDPELGDPKPQSLAQYLWQLTGLPWWWGKLRGHSRVALGQLEGCYYLPESCHGDVIRSTRLQLAVYGFVVAASFALGQPWLLVTYWLLPLAVGQPLLRFVLFAEHTGCSDDDNPLTNTRTTLTLWPLRRLMWNMPYHTEHHLYPSIPFYALSQAHTELQGHIAQIEPGYSAVAQRMIKAFD